MASGICGCEETSSIGTRERGGLTLNCKVRPLETRECTHASVVIWSQRSVKNTNLAPTGISGIGGGGGRKGESLGLTLRGAALVGRRLGVF